MTTKTVESKIVKIDHPKVQGSLHIVMLSPVCMKVCTDSTTKYTHVTINGKNYAVRGKVTRTKLAKIYSNLSGKYVKIPEKDQKWSYQFDGELISYDSCKNVPSVSNPFMNGIQATIVDLFNDEALLYRCLKGNLDKKIEGAEAKLEREKKEIEKLEIEIASMKKAVKNKDLEIMEILAKGYGYW